jgi:DNA-binding GntR family transcriptional regulator
MKGLPPGYVDNRRTRLPTAASVYTELRRQILTGVLPPGRVISEIGTAEKFEVSRTPVREALRELHSDGLVEEASRRQSVVITPSSGLAKEVLLMRTVCEVTAVREAATQVNDAGLDELHLNIIQARRHLNAGEIEMALDRDDEFHLSIARLAGFPILYDISRRIRGLVRFVELRTPWSVDDLGSHFDEHERLVGLLERGDASGAAALLEAHLEARSAPSPT